MEVTEKKASGAFLPINLFFFFLLVAGGGSQRLMQLTYLENSCFKKEKEWEEKANHTYCLSNVCVIKYLEVWDLKVRDGATSFH